VVSVLRAAREVYDTGCGCLSSPAWADTQGGPWPTPNFQDFLHYPKNSVEFSKKKANSVYFSGSKTRLTASSHRHRSPPPGWLVVSPRQSATWRLRRLGRLAPPGLNRHHAGSAARPLPNSPTTTPAAGSLAAVAAPAGRRPTQIGNAQSRDDFHGWGRLGSERTRWFASKMTREG
jgi:hypothetical protein